MSLPSSSDSSLDTRSASSSMPTAGGSRKGYEIRWELAPAEPAPAAAGGGKAAGGSTGPVLQNARPPARRIFYRL